MRKYAKTPESLKEYLDNIHLLCWPLLRWLVSSNRAHMQLLPPEKQIKGIPTKYQFLMLTAGMCQYLVNSYLWAAPEKEQKFRAAKAKHGSHYAFHGSDIGNWHSILRVGLKNFSNTSRMTTGAAYGPGIYLAGNSNISAGYMRPGAGWDKSLFGASNLSCIALAEGFMRMNCDASSHMHQWLKSQVMIKEVAKFLCAQKKTMLWHDIYSSSTARTAVGLMLFLSSRLKMTITHEYMCNWNYRSLGNRNCSEWQLSDTEPERTNSSHPYLTEEWLYRKIIYLVAIKKSEKHVCISLPVVPHIQSLPTWFSVTTSCVHNYSNNQQP